MFLIAIAPRTEMESFVIGAVSAAWRDLILQDIERGGDGELRDIAITLTKRRTLIAVHSNFHDDDRMLTSSFRLSRPLPPSMRALLASLLISLAHQLRHLGDVRRNLPSLAPHAS